MEQSTGFVVAVVDDDDSILCALKGLLESADHRVLMFSSAQGFLQSGSLAEIDCLISDIDMPGLNGFELVQQLHCSRPDLPVILITGRPELLTQWRPNDLKLQHVFIKPFDGDRLLGAVNDLLLNASGRTADPGTRT